MILACFLAAQKAQFFGGHLASASGQRQGYQLYDGLPPRLCKNSISPIEIVSRLCRFSIEASQQRLTLCLKATSGVKLVRSFHTASAISRHQFRFMTRAGSRAASDSMFSTVANIFCRRILRMKIPPISGGIKKSGSMTDSKTIYEPPLPLLDTDQ